MQLDAVQLCPSTHTSPDPTWPHEVPPVRVEKLASHLRALEAAGADEAILVVDPITERSTRALADAIVDLK